MGSKRERCGQEMKFGNYQYTGVVEQSIIERWKGVIVKKTESEEVDEESLVS